MGEPRLWCSRSVKSIGRTLFNYFPDNDQRSVHYSLDIYIEIYLSVVVITSRLGSDDVRLTRVPDSDVPVLWAQNLDRT